MKMRKILTILGLALGLTVCWAIVSQAASPMGTAFTYQGRLIDTNEAADGPYDFQFRLYDDPCDDSQLGSDVNKPEVDVIDGYFTVDLDFGSDVFDGNAVWLQVGVRPAEMNDPNAYLPLSPRQEVTPTPYALYAASGPGVPVPLELIGSAVVPNAVIKATNTGNGHGVFGESTSGSGVYGRNSDSGNYGFISSSIYGVYGRSHSDGGSGVFGRSDSILGYGVYGSNPGGYAGYFSGKAKVTGDLIADANVGIGTTSPGAMLDVRGDAIFNEDGSDSDFRVESANDTSMLLVDASLDAIGIGTTAFPGYTLSVDGSGLNDQYTLYVRNTSPWDGGISYGIYSACATTYGIYSITSGKNGVGGSFYANGSLGTSTKYGVRGTAAGNDVENYGVWGRGSGAATNYGGYFEADTSGTTNYGIYAKASGAANNYAAIFEGGSVGIGTTSPGVYDVAADNLVVDDSGNSGITIASGPNSLGNIYFADGTTGFDKYRGFVQYRHGALGERLRFGADGVEIMSLSNGRVGIGTNSPASRLEVAGGCITGSMCSDIRLKKNIMPLSSDDSILDKLMGLEAVTFEWKHRDDGKRQIGLIAQDVEEVFPEVVTTPDDDSCEKGLLATGMDAVLVEAIKELKAENELLRQRLEGLERTMQLLAKAKEVQL